MTGMNIIGMPEGVLLYNASGTPCDCAQGPCSCGAWHTVKETQDRIQTAMQKLELSEEQRSTAQEALDMLSPGQG